MAHFINYTRKNSIVIVAIFAALLSSFFIKPDHLYSSYFDFKTLSSLFLMLGIVAAFKNIYFFRIIAYKIVSLFKTTRSAILALVYITFIGSMVMANDMALITFLPLGYYVLSSTKQEQHMAFTFIMQNIAANLGGMLTPFGNPQNLYLYSYFHIDSLEFMHIMLIPFLLSMFMITITCLFVKQEKLVIIDRFDHKLDVKRTIVYTLLFIFFLLIIFRLVPYLYGLILITLILFVLDKKSLKEIDYPLLVTFTAFFIFAGNVSRIDVIKDILNGFMNKSTLLTGVISCQFISNVPSAILLSHFTTNYQELLVAVNIGGAGTLIASLASLITFREYMKYNPNKQWTYIKLFSLYNFSFLIILLMVSLWLY